MYIITFFLLFLISRVRGKNALEVTSPTGRRKYYLTVENCTKMKQIFLCSAIIILLLSLRHDYVGTDTQNYRWTYSVIENTYNFSRKKMLDINAENGYYIMLLLAHKIGLPFRAILLWQAIVYTYALGKLIYRYSDDVVLSYVLFFLFGYFIFSTTQRQAFALSFTILAYLCARKKFFLGFLTYMVIAISFHSSAIVFLPVYFLVKIRPRKKLISWGIALFFAIFFTRKQVITATLAFLNEQYTESYVVGWSLLLVLVPLYLLPLISQNDILKKNSEWIMIAVALMVYPYATYNPFFSRLLKYFTIYELVYIPKVASSLSHKNRRLIITATMIYGLFGFIIMDRRAGVRTIPYVFWWQQYPDYINAVSHLLPAGKF